MLLQHTCPYCKRIFLYDDGVGASIEANVQRLPAYCPVCIDPNRVPGYTYEKESMIRAYMRTLPPDYLDLDRDTLQEMMFEQFPLTKEYWYKTTYRTITLYEQTPFPDNRFILGIADFHRVKQVVGHRIYPHRQIICNRCKKKTFAPKGLALCYFFGFVVKICRKCDQHLVHHPGNPKPTFGGKIYNGGMKKRKDSLRARAKALNVSLNDLRRGITSGPPVLSPGTQVNGLTIQKAFWDETRNVYEPRYLLQCPKCKLMFAIAQKRVQTLQHYC